MSRTGYASPKLSRTKTTLWNLFHLYLNVIIGIARGILIIPLYLKFISGDLYGAWLATGNILMWLTLFEPGVGDVATQKISEAYGNNDKATIKYIVSSSIFISSIICLLVLVIGVSFTDTFINFIKIPSTIDHQHLLKAFNISIVSTAITLFFYSLSGSIIGFQQVKILGWFRNASSILALVINLILLFKGYQLLSISYSSLIAAIFQASSYAIILFVVMRREKISFAFSIKFLKSYSRVFTFTFLSKIFSTIAQNIDLIIVSRFVSLDKVTILELSRRPIKVIRGLAITPSQAMLPTIAHLFGEQNTERLKVVMDKTLRIFHLSFILVAAGFIAFNRPLLTIWVGKQYYIGDFLNVALVLTFLFSTSAYVFSNFTYSIGKIKENSIFEIIKNSASILLLVIFGYFWKLKGVVLVGLLITVLTELWYYPYLLNKTLNFSIVKINSFRKEILLALIGSGIITYFFSLVNPIGWINLILSASIFILLNFALFLIVSKVLRETVIRSVKNSINWRFK